MKHLQSIKGRNAARARWDKEEPDARRYVLATLLQGYGFQGTHKFLLEINKTSITHDNFYKVQSQMIPLIVKAAKDSCAKVKDEMEACPFSHDTCWCGRRNASHSVTDFVELSTGKIFDYCIISKRHC